MKNNLVDDLFDKSKTYKMAILCTYGLNIEFLENYLLNLDGLSNCDNICIFVDHSTYEGIFNSNAILKTKWINKRYLLTPIDTKGIFHPKLYILASDRAIKVGIGSANMTREGIASNLEMISMFEITKTKKTHVSLMIQCMEFIRQVAEHSNSHQALECVEEFFSYTDKLLSGIEAPNKVSILHNLNESIGAQVLRNLNHDSVIEIKVISPFYDKNLDMYKWFKKEFPKADIDLYIQQGKSNFPVQTYLKHNYDMGIYTYHNQERFIHGKVIIFVTKNKSYMLMGSANFTKSALLSSEFNGNIEIGVWGEISDKEIEVVLKPNGYTPIIMNDASMLETVSIKDETSDTNELIVLDWVIEAIIEDNKLSIKTNCKYDYTAQWIYFNGKEDEAIRFKDEVMLEDVNKCEILYIHISGINKEGAEVVSGRVFTIKLSTEKGSYKKKRYSVTNPMQLEEILRDLIQNGTEDEIIDYLLRFNIPLDLVWFNSRSGGLRPVESKGNVFGNLIVQNSRIINHPQMYKAVEYFLDSNYNKLCQHYDNVQLNKLSNFMLIFFSIFTFINTIHCQIVSTYKKELPIVAEDWSLMRKYYDLFLQYSKYCLELVWLTDNEYISFSELVTNEIRKDSQKILGDINTFQEFIVKMGYEEYFNDCYKTVRRLDAQVNKYIQQGKIITKVGTIVKPPLAKNGINDNYIKNSKQLCSYVNMLANKTKLI